MLCCTVQENNFVSIYDRMTWSDARLKGVAAEDDKSETFVAQARTLLEACEVPIVSRPLPSSCPHVAKLLRLLSACPSLSCQV